MRDIIKRRLPNNPVQAGKLAVTIKYSDKTEYSCCPPYELRVEAFGSPNTELAGGAKLRTRKVCEKLAKVNASRDSRVVPVIKLAKAMADCFITREDRKFSGYHIESLAIGLRRLSGSLDPKTMLNRLYRHSTKAVMSPMTDSTGQSRYG